MAADDAIGGMGRWVGLLGLSQGAKMAGCLLLRQQRQNETQHSQLGYDRNGDAIHQPNGHGYETDSNLRC